MSAGKQSKSTGLVPVPEWPAAERDGMDVQLPQKSRWPRRLVLLGGTVAVLAAATVGISRLKPTAPNIEKGSVWSDTVKRGSMVRQVRGTGTLVPEDIRWVTAASPGRVERIPLLPGVAVKPDTILVELSNPELEQTVLELDSQASAASAQREKLRLQLENEQLALKSVIASLRSDAAIARIEADGDEELWKNGNGPDLNAKRSRAKATELANRIELEETRLATLIRSAKAQLVVQDAEAARTRALQRLRHQELDGLKVRAVIAGVLQRLGDEQQPLRVGQHVAAGVPLARIANQTRLKAEVKIAETQAKDVQLGQAAAIDTRNGIVAGKVTRIDPAVQNGTVTVDIALEGPLPAGARPDLTVDGTITLERLQDVLYVGRPVGIQAEGPARIYKLVGDGFAVRVPVRIGRGSVDTFEVVEGLVAGDQVIVSDMSQWDGHDRVRIN